MIWSVTQGLFGFFCCIIMMIFDSSILRKASIHQTAAIDEILEIILVQFIKGPRHVPFRALEPLE